MASCGIARRYLLREKPSNQRYRLLRGGLLAWACWIGLAGCVPATLRYGFPPQSDRLATLTPGVSNTGDILLALGQPRGDGVARFALDPAPRQIFFYEYIEAGTYSGQVAMSMLLVFVRDERYDGHLFFSSAQQLRTR